uniref:Uncharacterized protein n=1 Tax=Oryza nivara TaxID=4536 RepID=A0A0E0GQ03_ORYNI
MRLNHKYFSNLNNIANSSPQGIMKVSILESITNGFHLCCRSFEPVASAHILKELDELKTKTKKTIIEDVEKVKRLESEDRNALNRAVGIWKAGRDAPHKDAKFATDASI